MRTTADVDAFVAGDLKRPADVHAQHGYVHDSTKAEFVRNSVPVHLFTKEQTRYTPHSPTVDREHVTVVALEDLISMKLATGTKNVLRSQDLADVIGLIRCRKLVAAVQSEGK